jgi:ribosome-associated translation inhibitor RaiA
MDAAPVISFHNLDRSPAVENIVKHRIEKLEKRHARITGCELTIEAPQKVKRKARTFRVKLNLHLPGKDVLVGREAAQGSAQDDVVLAVNRAFSAAEKVLKRLKKKRNALEVKQHPPVLHGTITEIEPELGYGQLRADDGREVYFQRDALTSNFWDQLACGTRLRFREMKGEKGPFAAAVTLAP